MAIWTIFFLISLEGLCGGLAYVNVFYRLTKSVEDVDSSGKSEERKKSEREFRIASVGFADTLGILCASLLSIGLEPWLCGVQVGRGRDLCREI